MEKPNTEVYSLHRYLDEEGKPDFNKIFSGIDAQQSEFRSRFWINRHLDEGLLKIMDNQPDIVRTHKFVTGHLEKCKECRAKYDECRNGHSDQGDLPF